MGRKKPKPRKPAPEPMPCTKYTGTAAQLRLAFAGWWAQMIEDIEGAKIYLLHGELRRDLTDVRRMRLFGGDGFLAPPCTRDELREVWRSTLRPGDVGYKRERKAK